jgi:tetratricopeptide (TPR) repeat protein
VFETGDTIEDQYTVEKVASGGMGVVLIVRDGFSGTPLAAKTIRDEALTSSAVRDRFQREARTWMNLGRHENLVSALFYREIEGRPFLFLEYVDGEEIKTLLERDAPVPLAQVLDWGLQLCRGMRRAHQTEIEAGHPGLVHRDLKPSNLFVTRERVLKVSDFGMAKVRDRALESTAEGIGMGTPYYMPPEQLRDAGSADERADVYAAGMVLYELATGVLPLRAERIENQIYNILNVVPPPASSLNPRLPPELDTILGRCLDKRRENRFVSFTELAEQLATVARSVGDDLADAGASCGSCGLPTRAGPGDCPLCGAPTGPVTSFRSVAEAPRTVVERPPAPRILRVAVHPRAVRTGQEITVSVEITNAGGVGRDAELHVPAIDGFRRVDGEWPWKGSIPPCGASHPVRIAFRLLPLKEGVFDLPPLTVTWSDRSGRRKGVAGTAGPRVPVQFSFRLPLVGRGEEQAAFRERLRDLEGGEGGVFVVTGEIGAGRTRLVRELADEAEREGLLVLRGKAVERGVQPLKPLRDGLVAFCGLTGRPTRPDEVLTGLIEQLAPLLGHDPDLFSYLANVLAGVPADGADTADLVALRWGRLYAGLASSRPLVLALDDLHWSEGETRDVLVQAVRRATETGAPLLLLVSWLSNDPDPATAARIERLEETLRDLGQEGVAVERRELRNLTGDEIEQVVEAVFPGNHFEADHPWFPEALAEVSAGHPYFLVEILRTLRTGEGELPRAERVEGTWRLDPDLDEDRFRQAVPGAVEEVLRRRFRALPDEVRAVAELAALLGEEFPVDLLVEVAGDEAMVDRALEVLERADLVRPLDATLERYRFPHALAGSTLARAAGSRSPRSAMRRHRAVAAAMRRIYGEHGLRRRAVRLGRHLVAAGEAAEGFRMLVTGARELVDRQAYPRAWSALTDAGALLETLISGIDDRDRTEYLMLRAEVAKQTGRYEDGLAAYRAVVEGAPEDVEASILPMAYSGMGRIHERRGEYDQALYCYSVGKDLRAEAGDEHGLRLSLNNIGRVQHRRGETERARAAFEEAILTGERAGDDAVVAEASLNRGNMHLAAGKVARAREDLRRALRLARRLRDRHLGAQALNGLGNAAFHVGRLDRALTYHRRALALRRAIGDREGLSSSYNNLGAIEAQRGEDRRALPYYRRSVSLHRDLGSRQGLAAVLGNIAQILLRQGEVARARKRVEEAVAIRRELGDLSRLGTSLTALGDVLRAAGDRAGAEAAWSEARDLDEHAGRDALLVGILARQARLAHERGESDLARRRMGEARARLAEEPDPEVEGHLVLLEGDVALAEGRAEDAIAAANRVSTIARRGLSVVERSRARRLRARAHLLAGRRKAGLELLRRIARDLERVEAPAPALAAALLDLGRARIGAGRDGDPVLARAEELYVALAELGRRDDELTEIRRLRGVTIAPEPGSAEPSG